MRGWLRASSTDSHVKRMSSNIRTLDLQIIDKVFQMESGYVLDFSDRTMTQFIAEELNTDIDHPQYQDDGSSKAKRLRCFLRKEDTDTAVRTLNALWEYREARRALTGRDEWLPNAHAQLLNLLNRLQGKPSQPLTSQGPPPPAFEKPNYAGFLGELIALSKHAPQARGYAFEASFGDFSVHSAFYPVADSARPESRLTAALCSQAQRIF
jgi:hypothetical protein